MRSFVAMAVEFAPEAPRKDATGDALDRAVDAETDQRRTTGEHARGDGDQTLDDVPADGQVFEQETSPEPRLAEPRERSVHHEVYSLKL